jgi:DNA uptake protein ComE-like DNA-binding protein
MSNKRQQSKRELVLDLCHKLLNDLDAVKVPASAALLRLSRIAQLSGDSEAHKRAKHELDGFPVHGESPDDLRRQLREFKDARKKFSAEEIERIIQQQWQGFPLYRQLSFARDFGRGFKKLYMSEPISKYEELLDRIRRDTKTRYTYATGGESVQLSAAELNKLVAGAKRWAYEQVSAIQERLEFGQIPINALETTFEFVDAQLFELIPEAAERLLVAYRNLAEKSEENWVNVVDTCRRVIKDFADVVFPSQAEPVDGLAVTDDKYLNRIRSYVKAKVESRRPRDQLSTVLELLGELLARTDNLASRSVHAGKVSRFEAERVVLYTYLAIGDILVLSGQVQRPDSAPKRPNLNRASLDQLIGELGLSSKVAAEILKARKRRDFQSWAEVAEVNGVGPQTVSKLQKVASL